MTSNASQQEPPLAELGKIFIGGISAQSTEESIKSALSELGPVKLVSLVPERGFAVAVFENSVAVQMAISRHYFVVDGKQVELLPYEPDKKARAALV